MLIVALIIYLIISFAIYKWLIPGQFVSAISNLHLVAICLLWPLWLAVIICFETIGIFRLISERESKKWDDTEEAKLKNKKVDP